MNKISAFFERTHPITDWHHSKRWSWRVELTFRDLWIGCYWETKLLGYQWQVFHLYVCLAPTLVLHLRRTTDRWGGAW